MAKKVMNVEELLQPDALARAVSNKDTLWRGLRQGKITEIRELRNYLYATDTSTTSNQALPWANKTTVPKLTQIKDNLHANYFAALFPSREWNRWESYDEESSEKAKFIETYIDNKVRLSGFVATASDLLDDFIETGMVFAQVDYQSEYNNVMGEIIPGYVGPKVHRISIHDITFDPTAVDFTSTPKIVRSMKSLGDIKKMDEEMFQRVLDAREKVGTIAGTGATFDKSDGYIADGFSSIQAYYDSEQVEMLTFYGDIFDKESGDLLENKIIRVIDRAYVLSEEDQPSWLGHAPIYCTGWRNRPDNLYAMGPLDNLVGMQYRIDHLENLKADVFDLIAYPLLKIRGEVEDFVYEPGARAYVGDDGDVNAMVPDTTALNADFQISGLQEQMEEMAGAPRQAMGFRTPGEKTAFEFDGLQQAANKVFQHKAAHFERTFLEPILNAMLEVSRRNIELAEKVRTFDSSLGVENFLSISKEDITAKGKIIPVGARHFAEKAKRVQEIQALNLQRQDPTIGTHLSGKKIAKILAEELGEEGLYGDNIGIIEQMEIQKFAQEMQVEEQERQAVAAEVGL
jgi:hypothetical protein